MAPGDLVRIDGAERRIVTRDYPDVISPVFTVRLEGGDRRTLGKLSRIEIFDPDGAVAARVHTIIDWKTR